MSKPKTQAPTVVRDKAAWPKRTPQLTGDRTGDFPVCRRTWAMRGLNQDPPAERIELVWARLARQSG